MKNYIDKFSDVPLFDRIAPSELTQMLQCIGAFVKTFDAGNYVVLDGDPVECVGVVITGTIHMIKEDVWGDKTIMAVIGPMQLFGETYVFGASNKSFVSFIAVEKTEALFLPFRRVLHTCSKSCAFHQHLVDNMVFAIAQNNLQLTEKLEITTKRSLSIPYISEPA
ncbi:MAG: cyclic nucleotide-binding domain-containing protein [Bacillota bacterium]